MSDEGESLFAGEDRDGNVKLDFEEFVAMQPLRIREANTVEEMRQWFELADDDGNGTLSINEFFKWSLGRSPLQHGSAILQAIFAKFDKNSGGSLDSAEFKRMAREMGFAHSAAEVFAVLDEDRSGTISYKEMLDMLHTQVPANLETKKMLTAAVWAWDTKERIKPKLAPIDAKWKIRATEPEELVGELRDLLVGSGAHVGELIQLFDTDGGGSDQVDEVEFMHTMKRWGFRGLPSVLDDVFAVINMSRSGKIDYDELYEFVRGRRHSLDARARNMAIYRLTVEVPPGSDFALADIDWSAEPSAREAVESLRILMQNMLVARSVLPSDLMRAWDRSGDRQLSKREFVMNVRGLFRQHPELWKRELQKVASCAFVEIQRACGYSPNEAESLFGGGAPRARRRADDSDPGAKEMDIIELERWLDLKTRRKPGALLPLKQRALLARNNMQKEVQKKAKPVTRPGCDIPSRAKEALAAAAAAASVREKARAKREAALLERWGHSRQPQIGGQRWSLPPLQRWEVPSSLPVPAPGDEPSPRARPQALPWLPSPAVSPRSARSHSSSPRLVAVAYGRSRAPWPSSVS